MTSKWMQLLWSFLAAIAILVMVIFVWNLMIPTEEERAARAQAEYEREQAEIEMSRIFIKKLHSKLCPEGYDPELELHGLQMGAACPLLETVIEMDEEGHKLPSEFKNEIIDALGR